MWMVNWACNQYDNIEEEEVKPLFVCVCMCLAPLDLEVYIIAKNRQSLQLYLLPAAFSCGPRGTSAINNNNQHQLFFSHLIEKKSIISKSDLTRKKKKIKQRATKDCFNKHRGYYYTSFSCSNTPIKKNILIAYIF